jgi:hypothetical protein
VSEKISKNRMALLLIAGIPVIIILASTWLWYFVASGRLDLVGALGTSNKGLLLSPPVALEELRPRDVRGQPFQALADKPLWRILILGGESCDQDCRQMVYYTRQIHTAMGKYSNRIERLYLAAGSEPGSNPLGELVEDYPKLNLLYTSAPAAETLLAATGPDLATGERPAYFVVDPEGWVILAYAAEADGKDIMADLKFLLKNSNG